MYIKQYRGKEIGKIATTTVYIAFKKQFGTDVINELKYEIGRM